MGHIRYGRLPYTKQWRTVISSLSSPEASVPEIASATLVAARDALRGLPDDPGVVQSYWFLIQILAASRSPSLAIHLASHDRDALQMRTASSPADLISMASLTLSRKVQADSRAGLFSEMAVLSFKTTLATMFSQTNLTLFESQPDALKNALRQFSTPTRFGRVSRQYFGDLFERLLKYFISKDASNHIGPTRRFANLEAFGDFERALSVYCSETTKILETFAGGWYSKQSFLGGLSIEATQRFLHIAIGKMIQQITKEELPPS